MRTRTEPTLVLFPGALGDAVCLEPAIAFLAESAPVTLYARGGAAEVAALYPAPVTVRSLDAAEIARLFAPSDDPCTAAWLEGFGRIVSFTGAEVPAVVRRIHATGRGVVARFPRPPLDEHAADLFLRAVGADPERTRRVPRLATPATDARDDAPPLLALLVGSGGPAKRAPRELHVRVAERWRTGGGVVCVLLGPVERGEDDAWRELGDVATPESVARLAAVLAGAIAFVGNDSGPSHVAAALGTPGVVLYAHTVPAHFGPLGTHVTSVALDAADVVRATEAAWQSLRGRLP